MAHVGCCARGRGAAARFARLERLGVGVALLSSCLLRLGRQLHVCLLEPHRLSRCHLLTLSFQVSVCKLA